ncbi:MAG: hypothetical protein DHS20C13_01580 [Thermodesulfobacteriota bacterium]|nr:MAG: hypothetical protein DHS20C13_01580 [Thermodesulfobacteriota bacterium]
MRKFTSLILTITFFIALTTVYSYSKEGSDQDKSKLIPGTDKPQIKQCDNADTAYIYDDYVIYTEPSGDFDGSNIYIFKSRAQKEGPCKVDYKRAYFTVRVGEFGGVNVYAGSYNNLVFLDQWTGRNFKRLLGIDVETKSLVFLDTYANPEIQGNTLIYYRTLKAKRQSVRDKIPCPEASDWESQGKQVLYVEKMSVNLGTMKKVPSGEFSCIPSEPISSVKPKSYGH